MFRRKVKFYPKIFGDTEEYAERRKQKKYKHLC